MIIIENLQKHYKEDLVLDIPKMIIKDSSINCFTGKNGSGKTTLALLICGFIHQTEGFVMIDGKKNTSSTIRRNSHVVLENGRGFYEYLTSIENIRYFLGINKIKFKHASKKIYELVKAFKFSEHLDKKINELSQGNRQKLSIILALIISPKLLILDEPTNGLDDDAKKILVANLLELKKKSIIIITTHDEQFIIALKATVFVIDNGNLILERKRLHDL